MATFFQASCLHLFTFMVLYTVKAFHLKGIQFSLLILLYHYNVIISDNPHKIYPVKKYKTLRVLKKKSNRGAHVLRGKRQNVRVCVKYKSCAFYKR